MADASIIDIGGVQWNIKDKESRERITALEKKTSANFDYTLDEKEIGTWLNGEKLYRLVATGIITTPPNYIQLADKNIKTVVSMSGVFTPSNNWTYPFNTFSPYNSENLSKYNAYISYIQNSKVIYMGFGEDTIYKNINFIVQIEYTKNE